MIRIQKTNKGSSFWKRAASRCRVRVNPVVAQPPLVMACLWGLPWMLSDEPLKPLRWLKETFKGHSPSTVFLLSSILVWMQDSGHVPSLWGRLGVKAGDSGYSIVSHRVSGVLGEKDCCGLAALGVGFLAVWFSAKGEPVFYHRELRTAHKLDVSQWRKHFVSIRHLLHCLMNQTPSNKKHQTWAVSVPQHRYRRAPHAPRCKRMAS